MATRITKERGNSTKNALHPPSYDSHKIQRVQTTNPPPHYSHTAQPSFHHASDVYMSRQQVMTRPCVVDNGHFDQMSMQTYHDSQESIQSHTTQLTTLGCSNDERESFNKYEGKEESVENISSSPDMSNNCNELVQTPKMTPCHVSRSPPTETLKCDTVENPADDGLETHSSIINDESLNY